MRMRSRWLLGTSFLALLLLLSNQSVYAQNANVYIIVKLFGIIQCRYEHDKRGVQNNHGLSNDVLLFRTCQRLHIYSKSQLSTVALRCSRERKDNRSLPLRPQ